MAGLIKRRKTYYVVYHVGKKEKRVSLRTTNYQLAKEKLRKFETSLFMGEDNPLPTNTPIGRVLDKYIKHIRTVKTPKSAQTEIYYLRQTFGVVCPQLEITSRKPSDKALKKPKKRGAAKKEYSQIIEASCFEKITTACISEFISAQVRTRGLSPKTANHFRQIIVRLFNWAMKEGGVRMPGDINPGANVERYIERASQIRYLSFKQIDEQINGLRFKKQLQTMVAMLIYTGMRREEILWLTKKDVDLKAGKYGMIRVRAKEINGEYWQPKTKTNRAIPISSSLRPYLIKYVPSPNKGNLYFPSPKSLSLYDPDNFSRDLSNANKKLGLQWTCLDFRHTFGSILAQRGESLYKIATLMGNSPEICRKHYAALIPEAMSDCVEFNLPKHFMIG
ncbi:tyrosine-type recombinase/integrase [Sedimentisphaera salicampi]|uniref:tyrosine-type recombinase/integrase n=1 Tax=Sedimentisphaera salicampi TaxID=1941349 RepID=UPI000B9B48DF|nr:tyrosine-type recombinase/integrase [Sedimentisphaera salicampi]OXU15604.1 integrase [Sedimentisphaera salicampi]